MTSLSQCICVGQGSYPRGSESLGINRQHWRLPAVPFTDSFGKHQLGDSHKTLKGGGLHLQPIKCQETRGLGTGTVTGRKDRRGTFCSHLPPRSLQWRCRLSGQLALHWSQLWSEVCEWCWGAGRTLGASFECVVPSWSEKWQKTRIITRIGYFQAFLNANPPMVP